MASERTWALVRLLLGCSQIAGATIAFLLLARTGVTALSLAVVVATCTFTTISVLLFGGRKDRK
jgi:hypothetical protein